MGCPRGRRSSKAHKSVRRIETCRRCCGLAPRRLRSKAHKSVRRIETRARRENARTPDAVRRHTNPFDGLKRCLLCLANWQEEVRRHTNPFDGLKLHCATSMGSRCKRGSKAHKSVRRIETANSRRASATRRRVRRHTNPFDGLKLYR